MASDYGDEAGKELYDWMYRLGQKAGDAAMHRAADRFTTALEHARSGKTETAADEQSGTGWAKLDMAEFREIDDYPKLRQIISGTLKQERIEHAFFDDERDGKTYLLFKTADAAKLYETFDELIEQTENAKELASESLSQERAEKRESAKDRDEEPLETKAEAARDAADQMERERGGDRMSEREPRFQENLSK